MFASTLQACQSFEGDFFSLSTECGSAMGPTEWPGHWVFSTGDIHPEDKPGKVM